MRRRRTIIHAANTVAVVFIAIGLVILANYLALKRGGRYDLTENSVRSVSDQTRKVLASIRHEVGVKAFFKDVGLDTREFRELIDQYRRESEKVSVEFIDPDREPGIAKKYAVEEYGTVVLVSGENTIKLTLADPLSGGILPSSEELITNALIRSSRQREKTVYFLSGHGERDEGDYSQPKGIGRLKRALEDESYITKRLVLMREGEIPIGKNVFIVAAPTKDLLDKEVAAIRTFLDRGGLALFLLEPRAGRQIVRMLGDYGLSFANDVVVDPSSKLVGGGDIAPIISDYPYSDITHEFRYATIFPFSRSLSVVEKKDTRASLIARTSGYAWSETNLRLFSEGVSEFGPEDTQGPLGVAAVAELESSGRIAVFGSVDFISNRFFDFSGNKDLLINTLNWLVRDEDLISIRPREAKEGKLNLQETQLRDMMIMSVVLLPGVVLAWGGIIWATRRNR